MPNFNIPDRQSSAKKRPPKPNWWLWSGLIIGAVFIGNYLMTPNYPTGGGRSNISSVKANMHTFQTLVETYAVDWKGQYPPNVDALKEEALVTGKDYWKEFTNPFTGQSGKNIAYTDITGFVIQANSVVSAKSENAGKVIYEPVIDGHHNILRYFIYGLDRSGSTILDKGRNFTLSNS